MVREAISLDLLNTGVKPPPLELLYGPSVYLCFWDGKLTHIILGFCSCGFPFDCLQGTAPAPFKEEETFPKGWNICKNCGIDKIVLTVKYQPPIQVLWDERKGTTKQGLEFMAVQGRVTCTPICSSPAELAKQMAEEAEHVAEKIKAGKDGIQITHSPEPLGLDKIIVALVECDVLTDGETWDRDADKNEIRYKVGKTVLVRKLQRTDPRLVEYLEPFKETGEYDAQFNYPLHKKEGVEKLFRLFKEDISIKPLREAAPGTKTALGLCARRGGCGGTVEFPRPEDLSILERYPAALAEAKEREPGEIIEFSDYKMALQLHFLHGFPLRGKQRAD